MFCYFFLFCFSNTFEVPQRNLYVPQEMKERVRLIHDDDKGFTVIVDNHDCFPVANYNVSGLKENIRNRQLKKADVYFKLSQIGSNTTVRINSRLRGGSDIDIAGILLWPLENIPLLSVVYTFVLSPAYNWFFPFQPIPGDSNQPNLGGTMDTKDRWSRNMRQAERRA